MDFVHPVESIIPGVQGRVLAVLTETTAELNLRTIARLAGVSVAQASRVLPLLVELGLVERREVPPASLFRLVPDHVATEPLLALARVRDTVLAEMGRIAARLSVVPVSVIVFGSLARGQADHLSDIDCVVVRPDDVEESDEMWSASVQEWRSAVRRLTGNPVEVIGVGVAEAASRLQSDRQLWQDVIRDGQIVYGLGFRELAEAADG